MHISLDDIDIAPNKTIKFLVMKRDDFTCQKCGDKDRLVVHRKKPGSRGGKYTLRNCVTLCRSCQSEIEAIEQLRKKLDVEPEKQPTKSSSKQKSSIFIRCSYCPETFTSFNEWENHLLKHEMEKRKMK